MTTVVGIFDNARDLDHAIDRLARDGFQDTVYDEAIVEGEPANTGRPVVFAPGYAPAMVFRSARPKACPGELITVSTGLWKLSRVILPTTGPGGRDPPWPRGHVLPQW